MDTSEQQSSFGSVPEGSPRETTAQAAGGRAESETQSASGTSGASGPPPTREESTLAALTHLSGICTSVLGPLVVYLATKEEDGFVADQAKEALNFQISVLIALTVSFVLIFALIGFLLIPAVTIGGIVFSMRAMIGANAGERFRHDFTLRLL